MDSVVIRCGIFMKSLVTYTDSHQIHLSSLWIFKQIEIECITFIDYVLSNVWHCACLIVSAIQFAWSTLITIIDMYIRFGMYNVYVEITEHQSSTTLYRNLTNYNLPHFLVYRSTWQIICFHLVHCFSWRTHYLIGKTSHHIYIHRRWMLIDNKKETYI